MKNGTILPKYEANNTPDAIDRTKRIIEFWPEGDNSYTTYEDDGKYIQNQTEEEEAYGTIDHVSYGSHVSTTYTSHVEEGKAVLTAECSEGTYEGYDAKRSSTFIVHLSKRPETVSAWNGGTVLHLTEAKDLETFEQSEPEQGEAIFFLR